MHEDGLGAFVQVGNTPEVGEGYKVLHPKSSGDVTAEILQSQHDLLEEVAALKKEVRKLKLKVEFLDQQSTFWTVRYSQRLVTWTNMILASCFFVTRVTAFLSARKTSLIQKMMMPGMLKMGKDGKLRVVLYNASLFGLRGSWPFILAVLLLFRRHKSLRLSGAVLGSAGACYMGLFAPEKWPQAAYISIITTLIYFTALLRISKKPNTIYMHSIRALSRSS